MSLVYTPPPLPSPHSKTQSVDPKASTVSPTNSPRHELHDDFILGRHGRSMTEGSPIGGLSPRRKGRPERLVLDEQQQRQPSSSPTGGGSGPGSSTSSHGPTSSGSSRRRVLSNTTQSKSSSSPGSGLPTSPSLPAFLSSMSSGPLPVPPLPRSASQPFVSAQHIPSSNSHLYPLDSEDRKHKETSRSPRVSSAYTSPIPSYSTSGHLPFPSTPDPPSPSQIDRNMLIGVGELATPRWTQPTAASSLTTSNWLAARAWRSSQTASDWVTSVPEGVGLGVGVDDSVRLELDDSPVRKRSTGTMGTMAMVDAADAERARANLLNDEIRRMDEGQEEERRRRLDEKRRQHDYHRSPNQIEISPRAKEFVPQSAGPQSSPSLSGKFDSPPSTVSPARQSFRSTRAKHSSSGSAGSRPASGGRPSTPPAKVWAERERAASRSSRSGSRRSLAQEYAAGELQRDIDQNSHHEVEPPLPTPDRINRASGSAATTGSFSTRGSLSSAATGASFSTDASSVPVVKPSSMKSRRSSGGSDMSSKYEYDPSGLVSNGGMPDEEKYSIPPVPPLPKNIHTRKSTQFPLSPSIGDVSFASNLGYSYTDALSPSEVSTPNDEVDKVLPSFPPLVSQSSVPTNGNKRPATPPFVAEVTAPTSSSPKVKGPIKKWSFSSALSLKLPSSKGSHSREPSGEHVSSPLSPGTDKYEFPRSPEDSYESPATPWTAVERPGSSPSFKSIEAERPDPHRNDSVTSVNSSVGGYSITPSAAAIPMSPRSISSRRLAPSSIPFFRRSSSSSFARESQQDTIPPVPSTPQKYSISPGTSASHLTPSGPHFENVPSFSTGNSARKSVLGMGIGMLKSSSSRRGLSDKVDGRDEKEHSSTSHSRFGRKDSKEEEKKEKKEESYGQGRLSSLGLLGRRRGKTISSTEKERKEIVEPLPPMQMSGLSQSTIARVASLKKTHTSIGSSHGSGKLSHSASVSSRTSSISSAKSNDTSKDSTGRNLPTIAGSPSVAPPNSSLAQQSSAMHHSVSMYGHLSASTPTKIPRISSRQTITSASSSHHAGSQSGGSSTPLRRSSAGTIPSSAPAKSGLPSSRSSSKLSHVSKMSEFGGLLSENDDSYISSPQSTVVMSGSASTHDFSSYASSYNAKRNSMVPSASTGSFSGRPPRQLPIPPSSSAAALTVSAAAKQKENRDSLGTSRKQPFASSTGMHGSMSDRGRPVTSPSKSASHSAITKLSIPSRIPSSSSASSLIAASSVSNANAPSNRRPSSASVIPTESHSLFPIVDDDEVLGDEEMAFFMSRQKHKKAANGATSSEIEAMMNFPEPVEPSSALTPLAAIKMYFTKLSDFERKEIIDYPAIYYVGADSAKKPSTRDESDNNHGYDDDRGDYLIVEGDHLSYRYEVVGLLGKGSFGQVLQCRDHATGKSVAVKIIRNKKRFHHQALVEVKILENLKKWDPDEKHYVIKMTEHFYFRNHLCIATELLSINLYELIKANSFAGFTTTLIRRFTTQLLQSLILMRHHRVVHCDLKPENILLSHPSRSGIKVIDFGSSCFEHEKVYTYIQSRFYRSPEVILGMNYHMAIDMWSLGCILAELYTGYPIFPGENEGEQLSCIMEVLGVPDRYLVEKSGRRRLFFDNTGTPRPVVNSKGKRRRPGTKTLHQVLKIPAPNSTSGQQATDEELNFVDFIARCLVWDPDRRLKPNAALRHPWFTERAKKTIALPPSTTKRNVVSTGGRVVNGVGVSSSGTSSLGRLRKEDSSFLLSPSTSLKKQPLTISAPTPLSARISTRMSSTNSVQHLNLSSGSTASPGGRVKSQYSVVGASGMRTSDRA